MRIKIAVVLLLASITAHADNTDRSLDEMEKFLAAKRFGDYKSRRWEVRDANRTQRERLAALDAKLVKLAGGHAAEIWGDGKRVDKASPDALAAARETIQACKSAAGQSLADLGDAYKKYEAKLARAKKIDANVLRFEGEGLDTAGFVTDVPLELVVCEAEIASSRNAQEDSLPQARIDRKKYKACGYTEWHFEALKIGGNKYGPFKLSGVPAENGFPLDCKKLPRSGKIPGAVRAGALEEFHLDKGDVLAMEGGFDMDQRGLEIYKVATVRIYSKTTEIETGDCGDANPKLVCAASGSRTALAYDEVAHAVKRAAVHKGSDAENCKQLLKKAYETAEHWKDFAADAKKKGEWQAGLSYKTAEDGILPEPQITARIEELGTKADEDSRNGYCDK